jgi:hypothetical protein
MFMVASELIEQSIPFNSCFFIELISSDMDHSGFLSLRYLLPELNAVQKVSRSPGHAALAGLNIMLAWMHWQRRHFFKGLKHLQNSHAHD